MWQAGVSDLQQAVPQVLAALSLGVPCLLLSSAPALTSGRPRKASFAMFCFFGGGGHFLKEQRKGNEATGVSSELLAQLAL